MNFKQFFILCSVLVGSQLQAVDQKTQLIINPKADNWLSTLPKDIWDNINLMSHLDLQDRQIHDILAKAIEINSPRVKQLLETITKSSETQKSLFGNALKIKIQQHPRLRKQIVDNESVKQQLCIISPDFNTFLSNELRLEQNQQQSVNMPPLRPPANFQYNFQQNRLPETQQSTWENCTLI